MRNRLFIRIFMGYFLITIFLTIMIFITSSQALQYYYRNEMAAITSDLCVTTGRLVAPFVSDNSADIGRIIEDVHFEQRKRVVIFNTEGKVLADTADDPSTLTGIAAGREFINALNGIVGTYIDIDAPEEETMMSATAPIKNGRDVLGVVMIRIPIESGITSMHPILFIAVFLIILFFSILGAVVFSAHLSSPIEELSHAAKRVGQGDFTARVFLDRNDEIKDLADRFNFMTERIHFLFHQVSQQKEELLSIISSLDEGLLVISRDDRIVLFNEGLVAVSHEKPVAGRYYWEVIRNLKINEIIEEIKKDGKNRHEEIEINNRVYICSVLYISSKDEIVMVLHDMTEIRNLEKMKKEFVTNVSHELRTPLTAIKGFIETIEVADEEKRPYYLDIIRRNADRMISIINDLLLLSEFDEQSVGLHIDRVDAEKMIRGILTMFEKTMADKGLSVDVIIDDGPVIVEADAFKLEQVFINLIDNAVKYTENGSLTIRLSLTDDIFIAQIADTGIGIPKEDLSRIFERFYRIDKSRSRTLGGTGLGLSIVKYIVLLHNGDIEVRSVQGVGTTFTVKIPRNRAPIPS